MDVSISHPTNRPNFSQVTVGKVTLVFSYETVVGFNSPAQGWVARENAWGPTTGKHINSMPVKREDRLDGTEYERRLHLALSSAV